MSAVVLTPCKLSIQMALVHGRHFRRAVVAIDVEPLGPEQGKDTVGIDGCHEAALVVKPLCITFCRDAVTDKGEAWRAEGDEFVGVDRDVAGILAPECRVRRTVLHEVASHPVVFASSKT